MANANVARGLLPYRHFDGSVWNGSGNVYYIAAGYTTALYIGDPIVTHSASNDGNGVPAIQVGATGSPIIGVFMGIASYGQPNIAVTRDLSIYHPASTAQYCLVCDDPTVLFMVQDDASPQAILPTKWAGLNANFVFGSGSTVTGYSGYQLQALSVASTSTLDIKIIRPLDQSDNTISATANVGYNAKWLVKLNNHQFTNQEAGV
jgi:hypothetical protein